MSIENLNDSCLLRIFREIDDNQTLIMCSLVNRRWYSLILPSLKRFEYGERSQTERYGLRIRNDGEIVVFTNETEPGFLTVIGDKIKQLYIPNMTLDEFKKYVKYLPRLERLHLSSCSGFSKPSERYDGPKLERLEILEIRTESSVSSEPYRGLSLMDRCPSLKSAFHCVDGEEFFVDTQVTNYHLEDLVIENSFSTHAVNWPTLRKILRKCPNLKHLAIRHSYDTDIEDENIPEMLELLPKVVLIDLRKSPGVTDISADYVDEYCKLHNRSIAFYYAKEHDYDIKVDWPQLSSKVSQRCHGYSFMVHCFLKSFGGLPSSMNPPYLPLLKDYVRKYNSTPKVEEEDSVLGNFFD
ncbi:uncharacterized protein LOC107367554 [Tetranychus urticae]|uniref:F-box domain-containing protein n=1 Tax=Tetranychus urticae TaxID=32264 RepID=T1JSS9_TETUR|nr:uncharacterized protein LOC107367554 [Tetranychus urticae]